MSSVKEQWNAKTYYEVLGVQKDATVNDVKKGYYKVHHLSSHVSLLSPLLSDQMARRFHPDKSDAPEADEIFKVVNEAYQVLSDEEKRATYDKYGKEGIAASEGGQVNPVDLLKMMFGGDAFSDCFGDLSLWEQINMSVMAEMSGKSEMTEQEQMEHMQKFHDERQATLVEKLLQKIQPFVDGDNKAFKARIEEDLEMKREAPGASTLLETIGYAMQQVATQHSDKFLGLSSVFAKIGEKTHRFGQKASAMGAVLKLAVGAAKMQSKMEQEQMAKAQVWIDQHPGQIFPPMYGVPCFNADNYPYNDDPNWNLYASNVTLPEDADEETQLRLLEKVAHKWFASHVAEHQVDLPGMDQEEDGAESEAMMGVFDQGLKVMWKLGVLEIDEIVREVCRALIDGKRATGVSKAQLKKRVLGVRHLGEKYRDVASKLKKQEKGEKMKAADFIAQMDKSAKSPRGNSPRRDEPAQPHTNEEEPEEPEPEAASAPTQPEVDID